MTDDGEISNVPQETQQPVPAPDAPDAPVSPGPITSASSRQDPLVRILAEMVDSALRWEAEHPSEFVIWESRLTEESVSIHLIHIDILLADANPESPPEGDTNVAA